MARGRGTGKIRESKARQEKEEKRKKRRRGVDLRQATVPRERCFQPNVTHRSAQIKTAAHQVHRRVASQKRKSVSEAVKIVRKKIDVHVSGDERIQKSALANV